MTNDKREALNAVEYNLLILRPYLLAAERANQKEIAISKQDLRKLMRKLRIVNDFLYQLDE